MRPAHGFTYLLLMLGLALGAAALAALGSVWLTQAQREREAELLFRGQQIRDALQRFERATPTGSHRLPATLDELLVDTRRSQPAYPPIHHLRQRYADPFTGRPDWVLLRGAGGGIVGVHSRSRQPALRRHGLPVAVVFAGTTPAVGDWHFQIEAAITTAGADTNPDPSAQPPSAQLDSVQRASVQRLFPGAPARPPSTRSQLRSPS